MNAKTVERVGIKKLKTWPTWPTRKDKMNNDINDKEISDWVNECPTHKIEVLYSDENGIQLLINFNNEKEEDKS